MVDEPWAKFEYRIKAAGQSQRLKELQEYYTLCVRRLKAYRQFNPRNIAAAEMGWQDKRASEYLLAGEALRARIKEFEESGGALRVIPAGERVVGKGGPAVQGGAAESGAQEVLEPLLSPYQQLAAAVRDRDAPLGESLRWALSHALIPLPLIDESTVPSSTAVTLLEQAHSPGGREKLIAMAFQRLLSQEDAESAAAMRDTGESVIEVLRPFCAGFASSGLAPLGVDSVSGEPVSAEVESRTDNRGIVGPGDVAATGD